MNAISKQAMQDDENLQPGGEPNQYQHQTMTLHNTVGLVFMSIFSFVLLMVLARQQARYHELAARWAEKND